MNVRTRSASSQINQVTVAGANVWTTNGPYGISISSLAIDQINPAILFAKGEGRLYKSTDGGASWASLSTPGAYVSAFAIDPRNSNIVYAGFPPDDRDCLPGSFGGIAKSTDGGETWSLPIIGICDVSTFAVDPSNSDIVYAGIYEAFHGWALWKSTNGGERWSLSLQDGLGPIVIDPSNPQTIYAAAYGYSEFGDYISRLYKSVDGGAHWNSLDAAPVGEMAVDPNNSSTIYVANGSVYKSTDGGAIWKAIGTESLNSALSLVIDPIHQNVIYAGTNEDGVFKSTDSGATWSGFNDGLFYLTINSLAIDASGEFLHAGTQGGVFDYQYAANCTYTISALGQSFSTDSASGSVSVTTSGECNWQAISNESWININSGSNGNGNGTVNFSVAPNTEANPRTGTLTIAGQTFIVNQAGPLPLNPIDDAQYFVRRHYLDFLNREPDQSGFAFWTREILACGDDAGCIEVKRINDSASFFLSIEFQETGYLVYRFYKTSYGNLPNAPVPIRLIEFLPDTQEIGQDVIVRQSGWEQKLESNKQAFAAEFVQRPRFVSAYPTSMSSEQFVDALFGNAGVIPSASERATAVNEFPFGATTNDVGARARALRHVAENSTLAQQEFNRAFVLMQYFGYLRRNPNDAPEATLDFAGYNFWLNKLNSFNGNYINAEMVKAFISSDEYRHRFGP